MKSITVVGIGFALLLALSWGSYLYIESSAKNLSTKLESVEQLVTAQKWDVAQENLSLTKQNWDGTKTWWSVLLDHQEIDNIDISISRLDKYVETKGLSLSLGEVSTLKMLVEHISDKERLSMKNLF